MGIIKAPSVLPIIDGIGESLCTAIGPMGCGDPSSDPSTLLSLCIYTAPTDILVADGDPTVGRAVADPIGRLGRVALPPVCAVGDGPDVIPLSATLRSEEVFS